MELSLIDYPTGTTEVFTSGLGDAELAVGDRVRYSTRGLGHITAMADSICKVRLIVSGEFVTVSVKALVAA